MFKNIDEISEKNGYNPQGEENIQEETIDIVDEGYEDRVCEEEEVHPTMKYKSRHHANANIGYANVMGDKPISFFERMTELIFKHGIFRSIGAFLLIMVCVMMWQFINALNYDKVAERIVSEIIENQAEAKQLAKDQHLAESALRLKNNGKIQKLLIHLLYDINADRVCILEMHNGKENPAGLPFVYCDMTYEEVKDGAMFVADEYEQLNMAKYPFFNHLSEERALFYGADDVLACDRKFYIRLVTNDTKYIAALVIKNEKDVGFLIASFLEKPDIDNHKLLVKMSDCAQELGILLDLKPDK